jgi:hypothetical protein
MAIPEEATVFTSPSAKTFHESDTCATTDPRRRIVCSLKEAVEADRSPCGNCVNDALFVAYREVSE